jgi:hypothetical protein
MDFMEQISGNSWSEHGHKFFPMDIDGYPVDMYDPHVSETCDFHLGLSPPLHEVQLIKVPLSLTVC